MDEEVVTREPLIDVDPPSSEESKVSPAKPAPAAEDKKTDTPAATDENAKPDEQEKELSRRGKKLQRERDARIAAETKLKIAEEALAKREQEAKPKESGEPKREDFDDYESYLRAVTKYDAAQEADKRIKSDREASNSKDAETKQRERQDALAKTWTEREKAVISSTPDYEEAVTPYVEEDLGQLSEGARQLIVDSELGPKVLHHLATNPDAHDRIAKLSPLRQVVELGKLEDSLQPKTVEGDEKTETTKPEGKKISSAPAPIKPVGGGKSGSQGYRENMSDVEYKDWRKSQGAAWAR